jgi:DNA-binding GntR family transcriptional regulator
MNFHFVLVHRTNNRFLIAEVDNLQTLFNRATRLYMRNRGPDQESGQEHAAIIDAVKNRDAEGAAAATIKNFQRLPEDGHVSPPASSGAV